MNNSNQIHWYPGHMAKALKQIEERLKVIDIVVELVDSRAPKSSKNPFLGKLIKNKTRLLVFTKKDLCDESKLSPFLKLYVDEGYTLIDADLNNQGDIKRIVNKILELGKPFQEKYIKKGMKIQPLRVMIVGIPNVGKSTLINRLVKKNVSSTANKPGHTKAQQWIRINQYFDLLDTPGVLPPHYDDKMTALNLAIIGAIKEDILPFQEISNYLIEKLLDDYPTNFKKRYDLPDEIDISNAYSLIAARRKLYLPGGEVDEFKVEHLLFHEFRDGLIGKVMVDNA